MSDGTAVAYLYDGTFEGLMTAIFEAYAHRPMPSAIAQADGFQPQFGQQAREIATDEIKAGRVVAGIRRILGGMTLTSSCGSSFCPNSPNAASGYTITSGWDCRSVSASAVV